MGLSDDRFLRQAAAPVADEPRIDWKEALKGAGDPFRRQSADFWMGFTGVPLAPGQEAFEVGQRVAYKVPSGKEHVGVLSRPADEPGHWVVAVDDGVSHIVPQTELYPTDRKSAQEHRQALRAAAQRNANWYEVRSPTDVGDGTQTLLLDIGHSRAAASDLEAYVQVHHNAELLDADIQGRRAKLLIRAQELPQHAPSEVTRGQDPGLETETMEGTGGPEADMTTRMSKLFKDRDVTVGQPRYDVDGRHTDVRSAGMTFRVTDSPGGKTHVIAHTLEGEVPCRLNKKGQVEAPYSQGGGPLPTREDDPGGYEDGDYVVKAVDRKTKDYWKNYYRDTNYGEKLTRDIPRKKYDTKGRKKKAADEVSKKDIVNGLMSFADRDPDLESKLSKMMGKFLSNDPKALLDRIDPTIYPKVLFGMLSTSTFGPKLKKEFGKRTTREERVDLGGEPQPQPQPQPQPDVDKMRNFLVEQGVDVITPDSPDRLVKQVYEQYMQQGGGTRRQSKLRPVIADRVRGKEPLGNVPRMNIARMTAQGGYLCLRITWDPEVDPAQRDDVETFIKFVSSHKEDYPDIGFIGKPAFKMFDPEAGVAEVLVASSRGKDYPQEFFEVGGVHNTTRA